MQSDDPAFLCVGTEISARFKGAFCEAEVKKINKHIKCKLSYKDPPYASLTADDTQIKGSIALGATVEVTEKNNKNTPLKALITNVKDCSLYTVVFDDGDERELRRSQLCLKGAKHYDTSRNLDSMPLTHPEQFGSPVPFEKEKPKKRKTDDQSSDSDSSEKSQSAAEKVFGQSDWGKIVCLYEDGRSVQKEINPIKRIRWIPAMIVCPKSQKNVKPKNSKDIVLRSFKDGKYICARSDQLKEFLPEKATRIDQSNIRSAVEKAINFVQNSDLPPHWDKQNLLGLGLISSSEESDNNSDSEKKKRSTDDNSNSDSGYSEERDRFVAQLYKFQDERGTPINKAPVLGGQDLDLHKLYRVVQKLGGFNKVCNNCNWRQVLSEMKLEGCPGATAFTVRNCYIRYLGHFDSFYKQLMWRMDETSGKAYSSRAARMQHKANKQNVLQQSRKKSIDKSGESSQKSTDNKTESDEKKVKEKESSKIRTNKESSLESATVSTSDNGKSPKHEIQTEESVSSVGKFSVGQKVSALHGSGSHKRWYDARVLQVESQLKSGVAVAKRCFIHYFGWKSRYDEWLPPSKIRIIHDEPTEDPKPSHPKLGQESASQSDASSTGSESKRLAHTPQSLCVEERQSPALRKLALARKQGEGSEQQPSSDLNSDSDANHTHKRKRTTSETLCSKSPPIRKRPKRRHVSELIEDSDESSEESESEEQKAPVTRSRRQAAKNGQKQRHSVIKELETARRPQSAPIKCENEEKLEFSSRQVATPSDQLLIGESSLDQSEPREELIGCSPAHTPDEHDDDDENTVSCSTVSKRRYQRTKRRRRNYSQMVTDRRWPSNRTPRKDESDDDSDCNESKKEGLNSPKDTLAALKARIQQKMEDENDWDLNQFDLAPIEDGLSGDALIAALQERMRTIRESYQQVRVELSSLERRWKRTLAKRRTRKQEEKNSKKEAQLINLLASEAADHD